MLRIRLLLQKQDRLSVLEQELERIDKEEVAPLFLGCNRLDGNKARQQVLDDIDTALADYGAQRISQFLLTKLRAKGAYVSKMP